jgi:hypothetical protein
VRLDSVMTPLCDEALHRALGTDGRAKDGRDPRVIAEDIKREWGLHEGAPMYLYLVDGMTVERAEFECKWRLKMADA